MSSHKKANKLLASLAADELSADQTAEVQAHLADCQKCRNDLHRLKSLLCHTDQLREFSAGTEAVETATTILFKTINSTSSPTQFAKSETGSIWRAIVKSRITKFAATAAMIIGTVALIGWLLPGDSHSGLAFADVVQHVQNARTLVYKVELQTTGKASETAKIMIVEPHLMRTETPDGRVCVIDIEKGKMLQIDPKKREAVVLDGKPQEEVNVYRTFRDFRNLPGFTVKELGEKELEGRLVRAFQLIKEERTITVWADSDTALPIRIEGTEKTKDGQLLKWFTTDIVFDAELDKSLFSVTPPKGCAVINRTGDVHRAGELANRVRSAANMNRLLKACIRYAEDHHGEWPQTLRELASYGVSNDILVDPQSPGREEGYIYMKPKNPVSPPAVVLYEAYDEWVGGINVGFADGHVKFISDETVFKEHLAGTCSSKESER
jgi:prepilin-type processing-associated H-X9-DG protein